MAGSHAGKWSSLQESEKRDICIKRLYYLISVYNKYRKRLFNEGFMSLSKSFKLLGEKLLKKHSKSRVIHNLQKKMVVILLASHIESKAF